MGKKKKRHAHSAPHAGPAPKAETAKKSAGRNYFDNLIKRMGLDKG